MGAADLIVTVTDRTLQKEFAEWFRQKNIPMVLSTYARGTATTEILDYLGLEDTEKSVLFCVVPHSSRMVRQAAKELWLDVPGRGILMTIPITSIGGTTAMNYLLREEGEERMEKELTHELIIVITNQGYTDKVMDAARAAGAGGGTAIHAKGTGAELARKFLGVSIAAEKEIVFILTSVETKKPIMKAIMAEAGMQTQAQSLVFSLPVSDLAGLRQLTLEEE